MRKSFSRFLISLFLLSFVSLSVYSQATTLKSGSVYHFQNSNVTTVALGATSATDVAAVSSDTSDKSQQWYVTKSDTIYILRNMSNGRYLLGNGTSSSWGLSEDYSDGANKFILTTYTGGISFNSTSHTGGSCYMHRDNGNDIVGWSASDNTNSQWVATEITTYSVDDITANWEEISEIDPDDDTVASWETNLGNLFGDEACTTLSKVFASVDDIEADADYQALPATLQAMVKKVYSGDWSEDNADSSKSKWENDYAKKYRVQMYEPYSEPEGSANAMRINAHTNINNPTGLYANQRQALYIMVEGEIKDGASLYIASHTGHNKLGGYSDGVELKQGLNVVPLWNDGSLMYINYTVHTFKNDGTGKWVCDTDNPLTKHSPLKIHIEGGYVNGYFNAVGDELYEYDSDEDWEYCTARANMVDFTIMGRYIAMQFPLLDENTESNKGLASYFTEYLTGTVFDNNILPNGESGKIHKIIEAWDRIMFAQRMTMGMAHPDSVAIANERFPRWHMPTSEELASGATLVYNSDGSLVKGDMYQYPADYPEYWKYYNHHGLAFGVGGSSYMYGSWDHCGYHYNTMESILTQIADEAGPAWGPAHEIGHQHQGPINLRGLTEVTNNFFSNVCIWYMGMGTSRVNGSEGSLENVLAAFNTEDNDWYTNSIWGQTHLYYKLWLYYHRLGNNVEFWPKLYELCRNNPMDNDYYIDGGESLLKFYKMCCEAASQDLTEFFRAHGFLEVMENRFVGDYNNAEYTQTQEQIDEAIAYVKALVADGTYKAEDYNVLLINDATGDCGVSHDGTTSRSLWDGSATAETGSYIDIDAGVSASESTVTIASDGTVTVSGEVGSGVLIFNENGELIAFSNKSTFTLSDEAAYTIATGKATVASVSSDGTTVETTVDMSQTQRALLSDLISNAQDIADIIDDGTYTQLGFYKQSVTANLITALESAKTVLENGNEGLGAAYELLYTEYRTVVENEDAMITISTGNTYKLVNYAYPTRTMTLSGTTVTAATDVDATTDTNARWQFVETDTEGVYKIYNIGSETYCPEVNTSSSMTMVEESSAGEYTLKSLEHGLWAVCLNPESTYKNFHAASNDSYKVVGWTTSAPATQWYITAVTVDETVALEKLQDLLEQSTELVDETAEITYTVSSTAIDLQTTNSSGAYYIWTNATNTGSNNEGPIANLVDGSTANYFHTQWGNNAISSDNLDHYIEVDLGEENKLSTFRFTYTSRSGVVNDFPQTMIVYGSNDKTSYTPLNTISSGMPTTGGTFYESPVIDSGIEEYRYLRFMVTKTNYNRVSGSVQHNYWHMAEFDIYPAEAAAAVNEKYSSSVTADIVLPVYKNNAFSEILINSGSATAEQLTTEYETLDETYQTLKNAYETAITAKLDAAKAELQALIEKTESLISSVGSVTPSSNVKLQLTTDNLYCNAPYTTSYNGDHSGDYVTYLTDGDHSTKLHTDYNSTTAASNGAQHYLRVDLGENNSVTKFKFNYTTRQTGTTHAPTTIIVEGCATEDGTYETIKELTSAANGLPTGVDKDYESSALENAGYRYVRFRVTTTSSSESVTSNNETVYYFVMSEFGFTILNETEAEVYPFYPEITEDMLINAYSEITDATVACDIATTVEFLNTQKTELQAAYDMIAAAKETMSIPVKFTEDVNSPILYNIYINRSSSSVLQYDGEGDSSTDMVAVADFILGNKYQAWYFMLGSDCTVNIYPYMGDGKTLATNDFSAGNSKVKAIAEGSDGYSYGWNIKSYNDEWYNITILNGETEYYFSNHGGTGNKMGFYNVASDGGSQFKFELADLSKSDTYYNLYNLHVEIGGEVLAGSNPGCYEEDKADALNNAYNNATTVLADSEATEYDYEVAYTALNEAYTNLGSMIMPEAGKYYVIKSANPSRNSAPAYANTDNKVYWNESKTADDASTLWMFTAVNGGYNVANLQTGTKISSFIYYNASPMNETAGTVVLESLGDRQFRLKAGGLYAHAQWDGSTVGWYEGGKESNSAWYIEETDIASVSYTLSFDENQLWATLMLNYPVAIPDGLTAHVVNNNGITDNYIELVELEGGIIPEGTPVILNRTVTEAANYIFEYTAEISSDDVSQNKLMGALYDKAIDASNINCYMLLGGSGGEKLYWVYEEYGSDGTVADGNENTDNGGYILCKANRAYLPMEESTKVVSFGFRFGGTTGIEYIYTGGETGNEIYDLCGRKLKEITEQGIYIVNGKKVLVK